MKPASAVEPFFDRQKSGYVRDFNTFDVFMFNVLGFSLGLAVSTNAPFIGSFAPSANLLVVILLGAVLALLNGLTYGWFGAMMPSTGGDFVFVSRSLSHRLGFLTSWGFTACQIYGFTINIGWILQVGVAPALASIGASLNEPAMTEAGAYLARPDVVAIGSVALIALYYGLAFVGIRMKRYLIIPVFVLALLGPLLMIWIFSTHSHTEFVTSFDAFVMRLTGKPDAYHAAITTAQRNGLTVGLDTAWQASLQALPLGFLCFLGFTYSVYIGGEVLEPRKAQMRGILCALALGMSVFLVCMGLYVHVVGQEFHAAIGLYSVYADELKLPSNSMNLIAAVMSTSPTVNIILQIGNLLWFLLVPFVILQVCTHNLVAWTTDGVMPRKLNIRSRRANTPWLAMLMVIVVALMFVVLNYLWGFSLVGAVALAAVAFFLTGVGACNLPRKNPGAFSNAPPFARKEILGVSLFQLVGLSSAAGFLWIIYAAIKYPEISSGTSTRAISILAGVYVLGLVAYEIGKSRIKKLGQQTGIDMEALFTEIPED